jgi:hypothetical protein
VAKRHGKASQECQQAQWMMDAGGQFFWPAIAGAVALKITDDQIEHAVRNVRSGGGCITPSEATAIVSATEQELGTPKTQNL